MTTLVTICGSLRKQSLNAALARSLPELAPPGVTLNLLHGMETFPPYNADKQEDGFPAVVDAWAQSIRQADGVVIVSPEYNYSVPGVLKNALDWLSRLRPDAPFAGKPVALQSVSPGMLGGARAQYHLRQVLVCLNARTMNGPEVLVSGSDKFSADGRLADPASREIVSAQLAAFSAFVRV